MDSTTLGVLAARLAAVLIALIGTGTTVVVAGQSFDQDEVTKGVMVVLTGLSALYAAVRTFRRGRLTPTSEHAIDLKDLDGPSVSPRVRAMIARIERNDVGQSAQADPRLPRSVGG